MHDTKLHTERTGDQVHSINPCLNEPLNMWHASAQCEIKPPVTLYEALEAQQFKSQQFKTQQRMAARINRLIEILYR